MLEKWSEERTDMCAMYDNKKLSARIRPTFVGPYPFVYIPGHLKPVVLNFKSISH